MKFLELYLDRLIFVYDNSKATKNVKLVKCKIRSWSTSAQYSMILRSRWEARAYCVHVNREDLIVPRSLYKLKFVL